MRKTALAFFLIAALLPAAALRAMEISADMLIKDKGETYRSKVYIKGDRFRMEVEGKEGYSIIRGDLNVMWMVMPGEKAYVETPMDPGQRPRVEAELPGEAGRRLIGEETVNGHPARKYEVVLKDGEMEGTILQWLATDLDGFPIKTASKDGSWSAEYRDIRTSVPDEVFEVPEGYEELPLPAMPGMGGGD
ncbi:MAG: DUF4412 domain-containing protein [Thermodesulfovibrionales bacterium]